MSFDSDQAAVKYEFYAGHAALAGGHQPVGTGVGTVDYWEYERDPYETHYDRMYGYEDVLTPPAENYGEAYAQQQNIPPQIHNNIGQTDCEFGQVTHPAHTYVRVVKRRNTANKKERRRTQSINTAFSDLRDCIPNVPHDTKLSKERRRTHSVNTAFTELRDRIPNVPRDTKLSKIKTLRLATSYISYLMRVLECDSELPASWSAELQHAPVRRARNRQEEVQCEETKRSKGRTGWPQHVWALELKHEDNIPA